MRFALLLSLVATPAFVLSLDSTKGLTPIRATVSAVTYHNRRAVKLTDTGDGGMALVNDLDFHSGTIVVHVAAVPVPTIDTSSRGFVGLAFRSSADGNRYENLYLRMTNGRADDQLRRNHSAQYESIPDAPWHTLREKSPGKYESYVDLRAGEWTTIRIVVHGNHAELFVNDADQPCLVVSDLMLGDTHGRIALWIGPGTIGYFSRLTVEAAP